MSDVWSEVRFEDSFVRALPGDPEPKNYMRHVHGAAYSRVDPTPVAAPRLLAYSEEAASVVGLEGPADDAGAQAWADVLSGNRLLEGMHPYANCYGGHQFGHWAGQLGDGRAITLGEVVHEEQRVELQLKGAGPTPYSRTADGRAVTRSSVREFLCSEAMFHLGVPTTRALSLVQTGDPVLRDMFYDGRAAHEPGAVVCRMAPSFLRFGNFELPAARNDVALMRQLADYAIEHHFPELWPKSGKPDPEVYAAWLSEVGARTAEMIVHWMRVGFVHGVMNTDNMSILGLTIDYGPYGWLEPYEPGWTPNTTDAANKRYAYGQQPRIGWWNYVRFASALFPLIGDEKRLQEAANAYPDTVASQQRAMMRAKLGLEEVRDEDDLLTDELLQVLQLAEVDMTLFYRGLGQLDSSTTANEETRFAVVKGAYYAEEPLSESAQRRTDHWLRTYAARLRAEGSEDAARRTRMDATNPKYVLRNYLAQLAIDEAEKGEGAKVMALLDVLRDPYGEQPEREAEYAAKRPEWARHRPGCSQLSCSS